MRAGSFQTMSIPGEVARESKLSNICMRKCMNLVDQSLTDGAGASLDGAEADVEGVSLDAA